MSAGRWWRTPDGSILVSLDYVYRIAREPDGAGCWTVRAWLGKGANLGERLILAEHVSLEEAQAVMDELARLVGGTGA